MVTANDIKFAKNTLADFLIFGNNYFNEHISDDKHNYALVDIHNNTVGNTIDIVFIDKDIEDDNAFNVVSLQYSSDEVKSFVDNLHKYEEIKSEIDDLVNNYFTNSMMYDTLGYAGWGFDETENDFVLITVYDWSSDEIKSVQVKLEDLNH